VCIGCAKGSELADAEKRRVREDSGWEWKWGCEVLVSDCLNDDGSLENPTKAIYLKSIPGAELPIICVQEPYEEAFLQGTIFSYESWRYCVSIETGKHHPDSEPEFIGQVECPYCEATLKATLLRAHLDKCEQHLAAVYSEYAQVLREVAAALVAEPSGTKKLKAIRDALKTTLHDGWEKTNAEETD